jgi:hypothetical protein
MVNKLKRGLATAAQAFCYGFQDKISAEAVGTRRLVERRNANAKDGRRRPPREATWQRDP